MSKPDFETILISWKEERGGRIPISNEPRISAYLDLIQTLVYHGYSKEDITSSRNVNLVIFESHNPNSKKAKGWREAVTASWKRAVVRYWPVESAQYNHDSDQAKRSLVAEQLANRDAEMAAKAVSEPPTTPREVKELDRSLFDNLPKPEVVYDEEMSKFLGFDE